MADIIDLRAAKRRAEAQQQEEQKQIESEREFIRRKLAEVSAFERAAAWRVEEPAVTEHPHASGAGFFVKQFFITVAGLAMLFLVANAGSLQPSAAPASTMHDLLSITSKTDSPDNFNRFNYSLEGLGVILGTPTTTATQIATTSATIASSVQTVYNNVTMPPFGGTNATSSYTCSSGTCTDLSLNQIYQFSNFTIAGGATLQPAGTAPGGLYVMATGTCMIAGTIDVSGLGAVGGDKNTPISGGGAGNVGGTSSAGGSAAGSGNGGGSGSTTGTGGTGGTAFAQETVGGAAGGGGDVGTRGGGAGKNGNAGGTAAGPSAVPAHGGGGSNNDTGGVAPGGGGGLGGAGNAGSGGTGKLNAKLTFVALHYFPFRNYSLMTSFGAGGGAGSVNSATGGAGGGTVYLECNALNFAGTIKANGNNGTAATGGTAGGGAGGIDEGLGGSNGSNGATAGTGGGGGGGGGGGAVVVLYKTLFLNTGSITVNGGNGLATGSGGGGASGFKIVTGYKQ